MTELSPAAQAVLDAYKEASDGCYINGEWIQDHAGQIAAALRAAVLQVVPQLSTGADRAPFARILAIAATLLALAALGMQVWMFL